MLPNVHFDAIEPHRNDKFAAPRFLVPRRVISTSPRNGGLAGDLGLVMTTRSASWPGRCRATRRGPFPIIPTGMSPPCSNSKVSAARARRGGQHERTRRGVDETPVLHF
ncbi:MAG: hypothetical protein LBI87_03035 [Candidatus Accumulibacter sp.]|jgi:hypothetical protein|nr:hypothetical protein [Accumulibacter sp.]